jgi:hypothetical protein
MYLAELEKIAVARLRSARLATTPPGTTVELSFDHPNAAEGAALISSPAHVSP